MMSENESPAIDLLIQQLDSRKKAERTAASMALREMGGMAIPALAKAAQREERKREKRLIVFTSTLFAIILTFLGAIYLAEGYRLLPLLAIAPLMLGVAMPYLLRYSRQYRQIIALLTSTEDLRAVGVLIEATFRARESAGLPGNSQMIKSARVALMRMLPQLRPEHASLLNDVQRHILYHQLYLANSLYGREDKPDLLCAILEAVAQIGDMDALTPVFALVYNEAATRSEKQVREAATRCLETLEARLDWGSIDQIGTLITGLPTDPGQNEAVRSVPVPTMLKLKHLLPRFPLEAASLITDKQWKRLYAVLNDGVLRPFVITGSLIPGRPAELLHAILDVASRLEDTRALLDVRLLASQDAPTLEAQEIRAQARELLPILEAKAQRELVGQTLLRASEAPVQSDTLLRPAYGVAESQPEQLLRASQPRRE